MTSRKITAYLAGGYVVIVTLLALAAPLLTPYSYDQQDIDAAFQKPGTEHWLGTDDLGRDITTRLAFGARISLGVGLSVVTATIVLGTVIGLAASLRGGWIDMLLMRVTDGLFAFPDILLAILIIGVVGPSVLTVFVALTAVAWPAMARLVRGQTLSLKEQPFVRAAIASGASTSHVITRHLLPHLAGIILAAALVDLASVVLAESALSFLGIGVPPPMPSWGSMINTGREYLRTDWQLVFLPCLVLSLTVVSLNLLGDALREIWGRS